MLELKEAMQLAFIHLENTFKCKWTTGKGTKDKLLEAFSQNNIPKHVFLGYNGSDGIRHSFCRAIPEHNKPKGVLWETWLLSNIDMFFCHSCNKVYDINLQCSGRTGCCKSCDSKRNINRKHTIRDFIYRILSNSSCKDCGISDPRILEFDHRDPTTKLFNIGESYSKALNLVEEEVLKCDIVCANCHRIRTTIQYDYYKNKK